MYGFCRISRNGLEEDCLFGANQGSAVRFEVPFPVHGAKGSAGWK